jgi:hypothetical protein
LNGDNRKFAIKLAVNMHGPETKTEREMDIFATNQVHENQCLGLNGESAKPF